MHDHTQQQSSEEQRRAKELSLRRSQPPGEVPGYELQQFLGNGAYGEVWVGVDSTTRRKVAVKFYLHQRGLDWSLLDKETEKLAFLSADRYVVQLLDVGWDADPPYFVMEYVENGSLDDYLRERGQLPLNEAVELFREIAVGLSHAHAKGVLHCDVKPANILLDEDHKPRLADFGQSRLSHEQTPALGTLFFMAPEQANLDAVPDVRWDVYALGAILYTMLTGNPPYRDDATLLAMDSSGNLVERLERYRELIQACGRPSGHTRVPGIDRALIEIVNRCLAVDPERRFATTHEVLDALRVRSHARVRRPLMMLGVVGPLALLAIMALFGWRGYQEATDQSTDAIRRRAYESNQFAARATARLLEGVLERYFDAVEREADQAELRDIFNRVRNLDIVSRLDAAPDDQSRELLRAEFVQHPQQHALHEYVDSRLRAYQNHEHPNRRPLTFESLFVLDARGTILAVSYHQPTESKSLGKNFAYRTYFHGGPEDLEDKTLRPPDVDHIRESHLSSAFRSVTTNDWKVGVSTPIWSEPGEGGEFLGVMVAAVAVGGFVVLDGAQADRFPVVVDSRDGGNGGTIVHHPLQAASLARRSQDHPDAPDYNVFRVSQQQLDSISDEELGWRFKYRDPLAEAPEGEPYVGDWIAATERVRLPTLTGEDGETQKQSDLVVLVQEKAQVATDPVRQLGNRLVREGLLALVGVVATVCLLWFFVLRLFPEPRPTADANSPSPLTPIHQQTTVAANSLSKQAGIE